MPRQLLVEPRLEHHAIAEPDVELAERLTTAWAEEQWSGRRVAVAVGSRGIDRIALLSRVTVDWLKARGARPFILPAMGSHGGGTPEGQTEVLAGYGVTEAAVGAPIEASMEVREVGRTASGVRVVTSVHALEADAVVLLNRVKPHTDFDSASVGSGLAKMSAIGLGKIEGAFTCHWAAATLGHERVIREVSAMVLGTLPRVYGAALVEDGSHRIGRIELMRGSEVQEREPALLVLSRHWMPVLPFDQADVLIVDEIGKDLSGTGMDTNIIGRGVDGQPMRNRRCEVRTIYVRGITPGSHGNAVGLGLADIALSSAVAQMDRKITYTNAISAMTPVPARIPINFPTDAECLGAAVRVSAADPSAPRILRIRNTLSLDRIVASDAYLAEVERRDDLTVLVPPTDWRFDSSGRFDPASDLLQEVTA